MFIPQVITVTLKRHNRRQVFVSKCSITQPHLQCRCKQTYLTDRKQQSFSCQGRDYLHVESAVCMDSNTIIPRSVPRQLVNVPCFSCHALPASKGRSGQSQGERTSPFPPLEEQHPFSYCVRRLIPTQSCLGHRFGFISD